MSTVPGDLLLRMNYEPIYGVPTRVAKLSIEYHCYNWRKGPDNGAECDKTPIGWFILFEGSRERMFAGTEKPDIEEGDEILIVVMKRKKADADAGSAPVP